MFQLSEGEQVYVLASSEKKMVSRGTVYGKIAFGVMVEDLNSESNTQLDKIIASVKQSRENTLLLYMNSGTISFRELTASGVSALVVFANQAPEMFRSLVLQAGVPFMISDVAVFICPDLETLPQNEPAKRALWNFMKLRVG